LNVKDQDVTVQIRYKDVQKAFSGKPEEVWLLTNRFFGEFLPSFEIASKLALSVNLEKLAKECEGIIGFASEGSYLLVQRNKLTDNETLSLLLLAAYVGCALGKTETDSISRDDLQTRLGKESKIVSTRLGELVKSEIAAKTAEDRYRITTFGLIQMQKDLLPRIRAKMNSSS
jgi:hypothetical protein